MSFWITLPWNRSLHSLTSFQSGKSWIYFRAFLSRLHDDVFWSNEKLNKVVPRNKIYFSIFSFLVMAKVYGYVEEENGQQDLKENKAGIINDPLSQTHSPASSDYYILHLDNCFLLGDFEKEGTNRRMDDRNRGSAVWIKMLCLLTRVQPWWWIWLERCHST